MQSRLKLWENIIHLQIFLWIRMGCTPSEWNVLSQQMVKVILAKEHRDLLLGEDERVCVISHIVIHYVGGFQTLNRREKRPQHYSDLLTGVRFLCGFQCALKWILKALIDVSTIKAYLCLTQSSWSNTLQPYLLTNFVLMSSWYSVWMSCFVTSEFDEIMVFLLK